MGGHATVVDLGDTVLLPELELELTVINVPGRAAGLVAYYGAECLFWGIRCSVTAAINCAQVRCRSYSTTPGFRAWQKCATIRA